MKTNYQKKLDSILFEIKKSERVPKLLLHACCAPCLSYVLEYLTDYFDITVFFYNPNITDSAEYKKRADELLRLIDEMPRHNNVDAIICEQQSEDFYSAAMGLEQLPEGGARCFGCYGLRLEKTARYMKESTVSYDFFATTLTVSPHKNAAKLNEIGEELEKMYGTPYLPSDFKKREGYKRSIELSQKYRLYRQDFCGCEYSREYKYGKD